MTVPIATGGRVTVSRFQDEYWWRRAIRKAQARKTEELAINHGQVNKLVSPYASEMAIKRRVQQNTRNRLTIEGLLAINEEDQSFTLQEFANMSVSNPRIRRCELMARISGFETLATMGQHRVRDKNI